MPAWSILNFIRNKIIQNREKKLKIRSSRRTQIWQKMSSSEKFKRVFKRILWVLWRIVWYILFVYDATCYITSNVLHNRRKSAVPWNTYICECNVSDCDTWGQWEIVHIHFQNYPLLSATFGQFSPLLCSSDHLKWFVSCI